jgi:hypothetical protein
LDDLYTQILSVLPQEPNQLLILNIILHPCWLLKLLPEEVDLVLDLSQGRSRLMLDALHSLLRVPPIWIPLVMAEREFVQPLHASFTDYLLDARRSGKWCIAEPSLYEASIKSVISFLSNPALAHSRNLRR